MNFLDRETGQDFSRGRRNQVSREAFERAKYHTENDRELIYSMIERSGGLTSKEVAKRLNRSLNAISGRFSELTFSKRIHPLNIKREGCAVYVVTRPQCDLFAKVG